MEPSVSAVPEITVTSHPPPEHHDPGPVAMEASGPWLGGYVADLEPSRPQRPTGGRELVVPALTLDRMHRPTLPKERSRPQNQSVEWRDGPSRHDIEAASESTGRELLSPPMVDDDVQAEFLRHLLQEVRLLPGRIQQFDREVGAGESDDDPGESATRPDVEDVRARWQRPRERARLWEVAILEFIECARRQKIVWGPPEEDSEARQTGPDLGGRLQSLP